MCVYHRTSFVADVCMDVLVVSSRCLMNDSVHWNSVASQQRKRKLKATIKPIIIDLSILILDFWKEWYFVLSNWVWFSVFWNVILGTISDDWCTCKINNMQFPQILDMRMVIRINILFVNRIVTIIAKRLQGQFRNVLKILSSWIVKSVVS